MAESCLPCSCACSIQYHYMPCPPNPPSPPSTSRSASPFGAHNAASSKGFCCQGNRHPRRHPMTARGEGRVGGGCSFWPWSFSGVHQTSGPSATHCPFRGTHTLKTQGSSIPKKTTLMHENTHAEERNGQRVKEREDSQLSDSKLSSESVCV